MLTLDNFDLTTYNNFSQKIIEQYSNRLVPKINRGGNRWCGFPNISFDFEKRIVKIDDDSTHHADIYTIWCDTDKQILGLVNKFDEVGTSSKIGEYCRENKIPCEHYFRWYTGVNNEKITIYYEKEKAGVN